MSDRNITDNQDTNTIYIPREVRNAPQQGQRRVPQNSGQPQLNRRYYDQQSYSGEEQPYHGQQPYNGQNQPYHGQQPYNGQNQQYHGQQPYNGQNQQYYGQQPYNGQNQQYHGQQPYNGQNQQYHGQQPYNGQNQQYHGQQPYNGQNQQYYGQQPYNGGQPRQAQQRPTQPRQKPPVKNSGGTQQPKKKKRKRKNPVAKFFGRFIKTLLILFLVIFGMYSCTSIMLINKMDYVVTGDRNRRDDALARSYVRNVLLIGTDGRTADEKGRSDTMIILAINSKTDEISLISLMRDCYVEIPNYGCNKLNAAYSFGGAELLMDTIEYNFGIAVEDYVAVNFVSVANIVDAVGGIDIDISDAEAGEINNIMRNEVNAIMGDNTLDDLLEGGGELHLNGKQALSYARIRYIGNADFERTERQRKVIELVMDKVKSFNPTILPNIASSVLPGVETNMSTAELYALSLKAPFIADYERQQLRVPAEGTYYGQNMECGDSLIVDFTTNYNIIYESVYNSEQ